MPTLCRTLEGLDGPWVPGEDFTSVRVCTCGHVCICGLCKHTSPCCVFKCTCAWTRPCVCALSHLSVCLHTCGHVNLRAPASEPLPLRPRGCD